MPYLPENHRCCGCGDDLGPDNGDGICCDCERRVCPACGGTNTEERGATMPNGGRFGEDADATWVVCRDCGETWDD